VEGAASAQNTTRPIFLRKGRSIRPGILPAFCFALNDEQLKSFA